MTDRHDDALPAPDPRVEAELAFHGVTTAAAPTAQLLAETMGVPTGQIARDLSVAFSVIAAIERGHP